MMKWLILFFVLSSVIVSCVSQKVVRFKSDTFKSSGSQSEFEISVPRDFKEVKKKLIEPDILKQFESKWSSAIIYISLDITFSNSPNKMNWLKCSLPSESKKCTEGVQDDGNYWREIVSNGLVIGYYDVPINRKDEFDEFLLSLKIVN